ncbi:unnamed protein product, partial [marine sediment metagenome]
VRFPSVSLTPGPVGEYGTVEISDVHNLAGKHPNANGLCTGTPFDLSDVAQDSMVAGGPVDINDIHYVRIVDIPGSGDFYDEAAGHIDPGTWPEWDNYASYHPVYDAWVTFGSGGLDLEAVGVLNEHSICTPKPWPRTAQKPTPASISPSTAQQPLSPPAIQLT